MSIIIVVAMTPGNHVIGDKGQIPWKLPDDLKRFKDITTGKPIIMGRTTHESIGRKLPGRENIVLTKQLGYKPHPGCYVASTVFDAINIANSFNPEIAIIGGGEIYKQTISYANTLHVTYVHGTYVGDAFFPPIGPEWEITNTEMRLPDEKHSDYFSFVDYKKNKNTL